MSKSKSKSKGKKRPPSSSPTDQTPSTKPKINTDTSADTKPRPNTSTKSSVATTGRIDYTLLSLHAAPDEDEDDVGEDKKEDYPARNTRSKVVITLDPLIPTMASSIIASGSRSSSPTKSHAPKRPVSLVPAQAGPSGEEPSSPFARLGNPRPKGISYAKAAKPSSSSSSSSSSSWDINPPVMPASNSKFTSLDHPVTSSSSATASTSTPPRQTHDHTEIEAECIICNEEMSEILAKAERQWKGGIGGGLGLWSCDLAGCGACE